MLTERTIIRANACVNLHRNYVYFEKSAVSNANFVVQPVWVN